MRDEVMTLLLAGYETTSLALTWTWYLLSQHPEVEQRLHTELDTILGGQTPTVDHLSLPDTFGDDWASGPAPPQGNHKNYPRCACADCSDGRAAAPRLPRGNLKGPKVPGFPSSPPLPLL